MKISNDVLAILSALEINDGAKSVKIDRDLDRKTYVKVNEVLMALGGKWNKKAKVHLFGEAPSAAIDAAIMTGAVTTARDIGFFPTPIPLAKRLCEIGHVHPGDNCLEPSAGTGNIAYEMRRRGAIVTVVERDAKMRDALKDGDKLAVLNCDDFMEWQIPEAWPKFDRVIMNPPFCKVGRGDHLDHVRHAFEMVAPSGMLVSVLPGGVNFREDRRHVAFRSWFKFYEHDLFDLPEESFKESGTLVRTSVLVVVKA